MPQTDPDTLRKHFNAILFLVTALLSCIPYPASGQNGSAVTLSNPWAGGLNSCQFCSIDLNLDGTDDLLIFDRHGNRILPYIQTGWGFRFAPQYSASFPDLHDWVASADYNCDGKMDLFTYGSGGVRVFENVSDNRLQFRLATPMLKSYYYNGYVGILLTPVDYPAISDIDGDGDLDLLTFFGLGSYVEYHRNLSVERFGNCDSLDYKLAEHCWGNFKESEGSNLITLGIVCPYKYSDVFTCSGPAGRENPKHTGSTMLATDLNSDGLKDLLLGDIDFPNLIALFNGGTNDSANMTSQDTLFPGYDTPLDLYSFPSAYLIDLDPDGIKDLLVSPFDPNLAIAENLGCIWYYRNYGTDENPDFRHVTNRLFVQDMLDFGSACYPLLFDLNHDGLTDLLAGSFGIYDSSWMDEGILHSGFTSRIAYFRNTGAGFEQLTGDLAGLSSCSLQGLFPAAGDLNGDGFPDLITGQSDGTLVFLENSGTGSDPPSFLPPVMKYMNLDVGEFSAPQLFDLDRDGLLDLIIGEKGGNLNYYHNVGTGSAPVFTYVTDSLGKINVTNPLLSYYGFSTPCFFRGQDQETRLMVGSEEGKVYYYKDIDGNLSGSFNASDSLFEDVGIPSVMPSVGWRTAPATGHFNDPELFDVIIGNYSGGLNYFSAQKLPDVIPGVQEMNNKTFIFTIFPNPADIVARISISPELAKGELQIEVFTISGLKIFGKTIRQGTEIFVRDWPKGYYFVKISGYQVGSSCRKLIVIH